jgi:hypothetical protein
MVCGRWCSPAVAREDEEEEAKSVRDSSQQEWWQGSDALEAKSSNVLSSV